MADDIAHDDPYEGAPPIPVELAGLAESTGRELLLRVAAVLDRVALADTSGGTALFASALHAARGLVEHDDRADVDQPLRYVREQYRTWREATT
ncbi:hypothetical protein ACIBSV_30520 [Embleya sp. NPDC050154]|uniref:hypothetical protein n=1 Tax=unclassified Embleya TaxID=2699296 RepID=UPI0037A02D1F